jgi:hypothetical protein
MRLINIRLTLYSQVGFVHSLNSDSMEFREYTGLVNCAITKPLLLLETYLGN